MYHEDSPSPLSIPTEKWQWDTFEGKTWFWRVYVFCGKQKHDDRLITSFAMLKVSSNWNHKKIHRQLKELLKGALLVKLGIKAPVPNQENYLKKSLDLKLWSSQYKSPFNCKLNLRCTNSKFNCQYVNFNCMCYFLTCMTTECMWLN